MYIPPEKGAAQAVSSVEASFTICTFKARNSFQYWISSNTEHVVTGKVFALNLFH